MKSQEDEVTKRIRAQIEAEVSGDITALYEFIDPQIRAKCESEQTDEPELTLSHIREFVGFVESASLKSVSFSEWTICRDGTPATVARIEVLYNSARTPSRFRTVWYQRDGTWYSTALGKLRWSE